MAPDTCFEKIKLGMFVGYGSGWQDGARNRLAAHPKGEFMPGAILRGWLGGREPLHKVPDHVPFSDLTIPDHVPFPRHIVLVESEDGHSMLGFTILLQNT